MTILAARVSILLYAHFNLDTSVILNSGYDAESFNFFAGAVLRKASNGAVIRLIHWSLAVKPC
jgi:hypothetical protein